mgnify:CR=1 FL=1
MLAQTRAEHNKPASTLERLGWEEGVGRDKDLPFCEAESGSERKLRMEQPKSVPYGR